MNTAVAEERFAYTTNCVSANGADITAMKDSSREITRKTFLKYIDKSHLDTLENDLGYDKHLRMSQDWHVSYYKGTYRGKPCVYFVWSAIEYVFT